MGFEQEWITTSRRNGSLIGNRAPPIGRGRQKTKKVLDQRYAEKSINENFEHGMTQLSVKFSFLFFFASYLSAHFPFGLSRDYRILETFFPARPLLSQGTARPFTIFASPL